MAKMLIHYITRTKISLISIFILSFIVSCNPTDTKSKLVISKQEYAELNKKFVIKIYFNDKINKIHRAYFDCMSSDRQVDSTYRIKKCFKQLSVKDDTIKISLTPTDIGKKKFENITIVCEGVDKKVFLYDTTFYYTVR